MPQVGVSASLGAVAIFGSLTNAQGTSQSSESEAESRRTCRASPPWSMRSPAMKMPTPGAMRYPNPTMPLALPGFDGHDGGHQLRDRGESYALAETEHHAQPEQHREAAATPVQHGRRRPHHDAADEHAMSAVRSASQPTGIWTHEYTQKKAERAGRPARCRDADRGWISGHGGRQGPAIDVIDEEHRREEPHHDGGAA